MAFLDRFFFNFGEFLGSRPKFEKRKIKADADFYVLKNPIIEEACQTLKILGKAIDISSHWYQQSCRFLAISGHF